MGTATARHHALEQRTQPEANCLAVPNFRRGCFYHELFMLT